MKLTMRHSPIITTTSSLVQTMIDIHITKAAQDVLALLPEEIERLNKLGRTEIAQALTNLQDTLQEATEEPKP